MSCFCSELGLLQQQGGAELWPTALVQTRSHWVRKDKVLAIRGVLGAVQRPALRAGARDPVDSRCPNHAANMKPI